MKKKLGVYILQRQLSKPKKKIKEDAPLSPKTDPTTVEVRP